MPPLTLELGDLAPFADLGSSVETSEGQFVLWRDGQKTRIVTKADGYALHRPDRALQTFSSAGAILASDAFADISRIARNQAIVLSPLRIDGPPVPVTSTLNEVAGKVPMLLPSPTPWMALNRWLRDKQSSQHDRGTDLLLIDGPAGVGKTTIVREAALLRAEQYDGSQPLIIQIASRGRVLQNIGDLIAFSLQDVRAHLTISQLIVLIRHGLITLAIDGFDELSDPNGFQTAWSGLNRLFEDARGSATFILAGRETFVSTQTILKQLTSFNVAYDKLTAISLSDPDPEDARSWLLAQSGWDHSLLKKEFVEPIFVRNSYALRPFFLDLIAREPEALRNDEAPASDLLSYLVQVMTRREADKFIEQLDPPNKIEANDIYRLYVERFLEEVARDLAENQSDSIAEEALDLIATISADGLLPDDQVASVVQRARTVVFLANDVQAGHVRFAHDQLQQHFLSREALRAVGNGETPRYLRRNLFSHESLEIFAHVARGRVEEAMLFLAAVRSGLSTPSRDRTIINLSALGISAACGARPVDANLSIINVDLNELHFPFSPPEGISIKDSIISILRAASADIRNVDFSGSVVITTLEIDRSTLLPPSIPIPQILVSQGRTIADGSEITKILNGGFSKESNEERKWPDSLLELLGRIDRYRGFWLKVDADDTDRQGRRIILHAEWSRLLQAMKQLELVTIRSIPASGSPADFVHFRKDSQL